MCLFLQLYFKARKQSIISSWFETNIIQKTTCASTNSSFLWQILEKSPQLFHINGGFFPCGQKCDGLTRVRARTRLFWTQQITIWGSKTPTSRSKSNSRKMSVKGTLQYLRRQFRGEAGPIVICRAHFGSGEIIWPQMSHRNQTCPIKTNSRCESSSIHICCLTFA